MKSLTLLLAAALLLAGCQSRLERRIDANRATWNQLNDNDRQRLARGDARVGDSEGAVRIALGTPDRTLVITGADGRQQTVWQYDMLVDATGNRALDLNAEPPHPYTQTQTVTFRNGVVFNPPRQTSPVVMLTPEELAWRDAVSLTIRLNDLVKLTLTQRREAISIYRRGQLRIHEANFGNRLSYALPIRQKMRAEIRTILTPEQQAKFDAGFRPTSDDGVLVVQN